MDDSSVSIFPMCGGSPISVCEDCTGRAHKTSASTCSPLCCPHHAPALDRGTLERAEDQALEGKADQANDRERGEHHVGVEEFFGVVDYPTESPVGCRDHLGADHRDPGAQER